MQPECQALWVEADEFSPAKASPPRGWVSAPSCQPRPASLLSRPRPNAPDSAALLPSLPLPARRSGGPGASPREGEGRIAAEEGHHPLQGRTPPPLAAQGPQSERPCRSGGFRPAPLRPALTFQSLPQPRPGSSSPRASEQEEEAWPGQAQDEAPNWQRPQRFSVTVCLTQCPAPHTQWQRSTCSCCCSATGPRARGSPLPASSRRPCWSAAGALTDKSLDGRTTSTGSHAYGAAP